MHEHETIVITQPIYVERDHVVYINVGVQGPAGASGPQGPAVVIINESAPQDGAAILIRNNLNGIQDSGKVFNDSGTTDSDIWSAQKVLSYTVDGGVF